MRRKKLHIRQSHSFPYKWQIGYWDGKSGYPDRDFRLVSLTDFATIEETRPELKKILDANNKKYC